MSKIFNIGQFSKPAEVEDIKSFIKEHKFCIIELDEKTRDNQILRKMAEKAGFYCYNHSKWCYQSLAIIVNGEGTQAFNQQFHRSISDVDAKMIPHKQCKEIFDENVCDFFCQLKKELGDIQIRGMREAKPKVKPIE